MMGLSSVVPLFRTNVTPDCSWRFSKPILDCSPGLEDASKAAPRVQARTDLAGKPGVRQGLALISAVSSNWSRSAFGACTHLVERLECVFATPLPSSHI